MKRTITLLLILFALLSLAACSSAVQTPSTTQSDKQTSEQNVPTQHVHSFGDWTVTKNATCTEAGEQERLCSCGEKQTQTIAAMGHTFGAWVVIKEPTCLETGEQERYCSVCDEKQTQTVSAKGHTFGSWTTIKDATCTETGEQEKTCSICGEKQTQTVSAKGHLFGEWTVSSEPTCTEEGNKTRKCSVCGTVENEAIPATGHSWNEATCTEPKTCSVCHATEGIALGHNYENGICKRCGVKFHPAVNIPTNTITIKGDSATVEISSVSYDFIELPSLAFDFFRFSFKVKKISTSGYGTASYKIRILDSDGMVIQVYNMTKPGMEVGDSWKEELEISIAKFSDAESITIEFVKY